MKVSTLSNTIINSVFILGHKDNMSFFRYPKTNRWAVYIPNEATPTLLIKLFNLFLRLRALGANPIKETIAIIAVSPL